MILEVCSNMSNLELQKTSKTSSKMRRVCQEVIDKRVEQIYQDFLNSEHENEMWESEIGEASLKNIDRENEYVSEIYISVDKFNIPILDSISNDGNLSKNLY